MDDLKTLMGKFMQNLIIEIGNEEMCSKTLLPGASILGEYVPECGAMAWVRLMTGHFTERFPAVDARPGVCARSVAIPVEMGILRSAPQIKVAAGRRVILPNNAEQTEAANRQYDDFETMRRTLLRNENLVDDFLAGTYTPMGPENGIVGGSWTFTFGMD